MTAAAVTVVAMAAFAILPADEAKNAPRIQNEDSEIPFYMTEEYESMKAAEREAGRKEAQAIRKSIEDYQERELAEAEEAFRQAEPACTELIDGKWESEVAMLENLVQAEAGNQSLLGRRLVAGVVLSRVDDPDWPDNIHDVIAQPYQMSSYWDGGMDKWSEVDETTKEAVRLEMEERSYPGLLYFTAGGYGKYGTPYFKVGDHYFSTK